MSRVRRILIGVIVLVLVLVLALGALVAFSVPRSFPETAGEIQAPGLDGPVEIIRDDYGVPHIYAATSHDLFYAQGYVHAQDRFWQMDFWRHQGAGRLAELLGSSLLDTDIFLRTLGWERVAREELAALPPETLAYLEAYAAGVNAYLADHQGTALSLEYLFLPLVNPGYSPQPWVPLNTMTWPKAMAWELRGNMGHEIDRAMLLKTLSPALLDQLFPPYPDDRPVIVPDPHLTAASQPWEETMASLAAAAAPALAELQARFAALDAGFGSGYGIGSNSWAVSGDLTASGMPLLANDPHLALSIPPIWYEIGLHCTPQGPDCPYEVAGFSFAGVPGVVIGHNDRIGWAFTNVGPDVMDLYIEKINPANPNQYEFEGAWLDMDIVTEVVEVAGGEPQEVTVRLTRHGPVISEVYGSPLDEFNEVAALEFPESYAVSLQWTALQPGTTFEAILGFNRAQNWEEYRAAARRFVVPAQNLVYADVDGNIGYQMPGLIPIRNAGHTGLVPVPGWTGEYEWQGMIPFEDQPFSLNPPSGFIVTANNAVIGPEYPYAISRYWAYGQRAQTILDQVQNAPGPIDIPYIQAMQGENRNINAEVLVPLLLQLPLGGTEEQAIAKDLLAGWDYQNDMESAPAAIFEAFWKHLVIRTFDDDLPEFYPPDNGGVWREAVRQLVKTPDDPLWDDQTTNGTERRDDIFQAAFADAVAELTETLGSQPADWAWGDLHTITFRHQFMDNLPLIKSLFNRGPFSTAGGEGIVNATGWGTDWSYEVNWVPSMRMIVDFGNLDNSLTMHTTGQSGHAYAPHYIDMADPWRNIEYHPMRWSRAQIEAGAEGILRLVP